MVWAVSLPLLPASWPFSVALGPFEIELLEPHLHVGSMVRFGHSGLTERRTELLASAPALPLKLLALVLALPGSCMIPVD